MNKNLSRPSKVLQRCVLILVIIASGTVVIIARDFIYPVCVAILLSYLIYPMVRFFEKHLNHSAIATLLSVLIAVIAAVGFLFFLSLQFTIFLDDFPKLKGQAINNLASFQETIVEKTAFSFSSEDWLKDKLINFMENQENFIGQIFSATTGTLVALGVQPVYIFFMLYYRHHFREFLFQITQEKDHDTLKTILFEITSVTKNYVTGIFIVVLILCFLNTIGLIFIGIDYAILFGVISAVMNFIPYFGTLIGGSIPLLYSLVSAEPSHAIGIIFLFLGIQILENNVLTPNITGGRVAINPLFTIFAIIIGGITWGIPGMFVSVPFLGIFKVICQNIRPLKPVAFVISTKKSQNNQ